jgi:hypothetical protein
LALKKSNTNLSKFPHSAIQKKSGSQCDPDFLDAVLGKYYITNLSSLEATTKSAGSKKPRTKQRPA